MKKWIITAAILLASATAANAGWLKCEIIQVVPGFSLQRCETTQRHEPRNYYRGNFKWWEHKHGNKHDIYAMNHNQYDRHYYSRKRYPHKNRDMDNRPYRRDHNRW